MTDRLLTNAPFALEDSTAELTALYTEIFGPQEADDHRQMYEFQGHLQGSPAQIVTDDELLDRAQNAENGAKFSRLWAGDTTGYPSQSEVDLALCDILAYYSDDPDVRTHSFKGE